MEIDEIIDLDDADEDEVEGKTSECVPADSDYPCLVKYTGSFDELFKTYNHYATINDSEDSKRMVYYGCIPQITLMGQNGKIWGKSIELVIHHIDANGQYFVGYSSSFPWAGIKSQFQKLFSKIVGMIDNSSSSGQNNIATHRKSKTFIDLINQLKQYQKRYGLVFHITPIGYK